MIEVFPRNLKRNFISLFHLLVVLGIKFPRVISRALFTIFILIQGLTKVPLNLFCSPGRRVTCDPPASAP